jgi:heptaprenyl diphosphate synthase
MASPHTTSTATLDPFARLEDDLERVRQSMHDATAVSVPQADGPFTHYVKRPGRLFRPVLTLVSAYIFDAPRSAQQSERIISAATGMELLHLATLCHDDLCDNAETRRGYPTVNAAFGDDAALLAGDHLLACSMSAFASVGVHEMCIAADTLKALCLGQSMEVADENNLDRSEDAYFAAISGKTAALMAACARVGAAVAGASESDQRIMAFFGHSLGMAFQIWDDVLDIWAPPGVTGKKPGTDIDNGVFGLPVIYALQSDRAKLPRLLRQRPLSQKQFDDVLHILDRLRVRERAVDVAREHVASGLSAVRNLGSPVSAVSPLVDVARRLMPEIDHLLPGSNANGNAQVA